MFVFCVVRGKPQNILPTVTGFESYKGCGLDHAYTHYENRLEMTKCLVLKFFYQYLQCSIQRTLCLYVV